MTQNLFNSFIFIAERLNRDLNIKPLLYGSLGLEKLTNRSFDPQDIDVLIPREFIEDRWRDLLNLMSDLGFELIDLHEHEFSNNDLRIAFASLEEIKDFAGININSIQTLSHLYKIVGRWV